MPGLQGFPVESLQNILAKGYVVALALVCLLQYVYSLIRMARARQMATRFQEQVDHLSLEVLQIERDRMIQRLENQILRDVLTQTECRKAIAILLKRFVPSPDDAFAAFVLFDSTHDHSIHARGLLDESIETLVMPDDVCDQLIIHGAVLWDAPTPLSCPLIVNLHPTDRRKVHTLAAVALKDDQGLLGVMISTSLLPLGASRTEQVDLSTRLLQAIAPNLRQTLELEQQSSQLQGTREMLELRAITDTRFDQPMRMIEAFLTRLCDMLEGDAVRLFLLTRDPGDEFRTMFRHGASQQAGVLEIWMEHEERLAHCGNSAGCLLAYDRPQLKQVGVDSLIGSALTAPVIQNGVTIGVVCITRRTIERPNPAHRQLLSWSAETLSHSIHRARSLVAIERQARQDGLTELANRRTFEAQMTREFASIRSGSLSELSLLMLDLDRFKSINDVHGHQAGDEVLRTAAQVLRETQARMLSSDRSTAARYGGEELALILPGIGLEEALEIAEEFRATIERQVIMHHAVGIRVTVSIGAAAFPMHGHSANELIAAADAALYRAKAAGRNRVECGPPEAVLHALN